jgi:drug/metabolite transporter (DMT)-like permease
MYYLALVIATVGAVVYHLAMKQLPATLNPFFPLAVAYAGALALCSLGLWLWPDGSRSWHDLRPSVAGVALGVVGIEVGFLLAYRSGWNVGYAALAMNACSALLLAPIAAAFFKEDFGVQKIAGMILSLAGLFLLMKK